MNGSFNVGESRSLVGVPVTGLTMPTAAKPITSYTIRIPGANNRPLVTIHPDGRLEFGENYEPDVAARAFRDAVKRFAPSPQVRLFGAPLAARINEALARRQEAESLLHSALVQYEAVTCGQVDGTTIGELAAKTRAFLNTGRS
ncbi:hypothetical protein [Streptomyces sp. NPDC052012]|uniref:hypothetical protein n=1 Tax=Streptomyces sp. NPDC052012 TaxID=3155051 RepID=UPI00344B55E4